MNQISVNPEHKYFHPDAIWCTVYLDEVLQYGCTTADADEGWIERYVFKDGKLQVSVTDEPEREIVRGKVRVEMRKPEEVDET